MEVEEVAGRRERRMVGLMRRGIVIGKQSVAAVRRSGSGGPNFLYAGEGCEVHVLCPYPTLVLIRVEYKLLAMALSVEQPRRPGTEAPQRRARQGQSQAGKVLQRRGKGTWNEPLYSTAETLELLPSLATELRRVGRKSLRINRGLLK